MRGRGVFGPRVAVDEYGLLNIHAPLFPDNDVTSLPSVETLLGAGLVADWQSADHGTAKMTVETGERITSWIDHVGTLEVTALTLSAARPTWTSRGVLFDGVANVLEKTTYAALPAGATTGYIIADFISLALTNARRRVAGYGSSSQSRAIYLDSTTHQPAVSTVTTDRIDPDLSHGAAHRTILIGAFVGGTLIWVRSNGNAGGSAAATINTNTVGRLRIGSGSSTTPADFAKMFLKRLMIVNGALSLDTIQKVESKLLDDEGYALLPAGHPYRIPPAPMNLAQNLVQLDTQMTAAIALPTPDTSADMAVPLVCVPTTTAPLVLTANARINVVPRLLTTSVWRKVLATNYQQLPGGILGYIASVLFQVSSASERRFRTNAPDVSVKVFGSTLPYRAIVDGKFSARAGYLTADTGSSNFLTFATGGLAVERAWTIETPRGNSFDGVYIDPQYYVIPDDVPVAPKRIGILGDSMTRGLTDDQTYEGVGPKLSRQLGFYTYFLDGVDGTSYYYRTSSGTAFNMLDRAPDVADTDLSLRNSLLAYDLTNLDCLCVWGGINGIVSGTAPALEAANCRALCLTVRAARPNMPIVVIGPLDRMAPAPIEAGYAAMKAAIAAAVADIPGAIFVDVEGITYTHVAADPTHASTVGTSQLVAAYSPLILTGIQTLRAAAGA